jgi:hypothetical protein
VYQSFRSVWPGLVGGVQAGKEERAGEIVNQFHWMDGYYGVPAWLWLVLIAAGCVMVILWSMAIAAGLEDKERLRMVRMKYVNPDRMTAAELAWVYDDRISKMERICRRAVRQGRFERVGEENGVQLYRLID